MPYYPTVLCTRKHPTNFRKWVDVRIRPLTRDSCHTLVAGLDCLSPPLSPSLSLSLAISNCDCNFLSLYKGTSLIKKTPSPRTLRWAYA